LFFSSATALSRHQTNLIALLPSKGFASYFQSQIFDPLKLIFRSVLELAEIGSLKFRQIYRDRLERAPKKAFPCYAESESLKRLTLCNAVICMPELRPPELFHQPSAGLAHRAFFSAGFFIKSRNVAWSA
jgi:hypothetical protein